MVRLKDFLATMNCYNLGMLIEVFDHQNQIIQPTEENIEKIINFFIDKIEFEQLPEGYEFTGIPEEVPPEEVNHEYACSVFLSDEVGDDSPHKFIKYDDIVDYFYPTFIVTPVNVDTGELDLDGIDKNVAVDIVPVFLDDNEINIIIGLTDTAQIVYIPKLRRI